MSQSLARLFETILDFNPRAQSNNRHNGWCFCRHTLHSMSCITWQAIFFFFQESTVQKSITVSASCKVEWLSLLYRIQSFPKETFCAPLHGILNLSNTTLSIRCSKSFKCLTSFRCSILGYFRLQCYRPNLVESKSEPICYNDVIIILVTLIINFAIKLIRRDTTFQMKSPIAARSDWRHCQRKIVKFA